MKIANCIHLRSLSNGKIFMNMFKQLRVYFLIPFLAKICSIRTYTMRKYKELYMFCKSMKICTKVVHSCSVSCLVYHYGLIEHLAQLYCKKSESKGFVFVRSCLIHSLVALIVNARLRLLPQKLQFIARILCTTFSMFRFKSCLRALMDFLNAHVKLL